MKFVKPSFKIIYNENQLKTVEYCARLCYKSDVLITDDSYIRFCKARFAEKHYAIFEHANFVFFIETKKDDTHQIFMNKFENLYGINYQLTYNGIFLHLNLRHIFELADSGDFQFYDMLPDVYKIFYTEEDRSNLIRIVPYMEDVTICSKEDIMSDVRVNQNKFSFRTVAFDCQRSVWDELARHRRNGLCCESSRYCQYFKGKFGGEISYSIPHWFDEESYRSINKDVDDYKEIEFTKEQQLEVACKQAEENYMALTEKGLLAQDARYVLPLGYRVNCVVTASMEQWLHIFDLRTSNAAHPDISALMKSLEKELLCE